MAGRATNDPTYHYSSHHHNHPDNNKPDAIDRRSGSSARRGRVLARSCSLASPLGASAFSPIATPEVTSQSMTSDLESSSSKGRDATGQNSSRKYKTREGLSEVSGVVSGREKPLRRQKSLAEMLGAVISKSKVQLWELFSRRAVGDAKHFHRPHHQNDSSKDSFGCGSHADGDPGRIWPSGESDEVLQAKGGSPEDGVGSGLSYTPVLSSTHRSPRQKKKREQALLHHSSARKLLPRGPLVMSHPDLTFPLSCERIGGPSGQEGCGSLFRTASSKTSRVRTPEDIFCVMRLPEDRPASSKSLDTVHPRQRDSSHSTCSSAGRSSGAPSLQGSSEHLFLKPDDVQPHLTSSSSISSNNFLLRPESEEGRTKTSLVKSNSDSMYRLVPPSVKVGMTKASSDNVFFLRRTPKHQVAGCSGSASSVPRSPTSSASGGNQSQPEPVIGSGSGGGEGDGCSGTATLGEGSTVNRVLDWLYVGSVEALFNDPLLCALGVDAVVDMTNVAPHLVPAEKKTLCPCACKAKHFRAKLNLAVDDIEWENIEQYFTDVNAFLNGWRLKGRKVLVASYHGRSRAPAMVLQFLMHLYGLPLDRALAHLRSQRPQTRLNSGFARALQRLHKRLAERAPAGEQELSTSTRGGPEGCRPLSDFTEDLRGCVPASPEVWRCAGAGRKTAWDEHYE